MDTTADTNWRQVIQKNYSNLQVKKKSFQDIKKKKSIKKDTRKKNVEQKHKKEIEDAMILDSFNYFLTLPPYLSLLSCQWRGQGRDQMKEELKEQTFNKMSHHCL